MNTDQRVDLAYHPLSCWSGKYEPPNQHYQEGVEDQEEG
jgi:hypothetical protein